MSAAARRAYGQARARARRAAILDPAEVTAMASAANVSQVPGWRELGSCDDGSTLLSIAYARLVDDYLAMQRAYPEARDALSALLQLHELENVKLLWRAAVRGVLREEWRGGWRPLGRLESLAVERFDAPLTLASLTAVLAPTSYGRVAGAVLRAHGGDLAAAELAFDRFGTEAVATVCRRTPRSEPSARQLLGAVVARRDALIYERARTRLAMDVQAAALMTTSGRAPDARRSVPLPALARRVMALEPFSLALPLALVLLREEEVRRLVTLSELRARHAPPAAAARALEALSSGE
jgi:vacuolar-type H+-ATPase subunit C/Vma6